MKKICSLILALLFIMTVFTTNSNAEELTSIPQVVMLNDLKGTINAAEFSNDDKFLATADSMNEVKIWNTSNGRLISSFKNSNIVNSLSYSPDNRIIASGDLNGRLYLWDVTSGDLLRELPLIEKKYGFPVNDLKFNQSGTILYVISSNRNELTLWDVNSGTLLDEYSFQNRPSKLTYNPLTDTIAIGFDNGNIAIRDGRTGNYIKELTNTRLDSVSDLKYSPDFKYLVAVSTSYKQLISYFDAENYTYIDFDLSDYRKNSGASHFDFSPNGKYIALARYSTGRIFDIETHKLVSNVNFIGNGSVVTFNHTGTRVLMGKTIFDTTVLPDREIIGIELTVDSEVIKVNDSLNFNANYLYSDGYRAPVDNSRLTVTSSNEDVLSTLYGKMMALKEGTSTLKITDGQYTDQLTIYVNNYKELKEEKNVDVNKVWKVNFSLNIDESTVKEQNIYITDSKGQIVSLMYYVEKGKQSTIQLMPVKNYTRGETYTLWVREVKSATGETLKEFNKMNFTIQN